MTRCEAGGCPRAAVYTVAQRYTGEGLPLTVPEPRRLCQEHAEALRAADAAHDHRRVEETLRIPEREIVRLAHLQARALTGRLDPVAIVGVVAALLEIGLGVESRHLAPALDIIMRRLPDRDEEEE